MLTPRQAEVAALVARGHSDKRIARELGVSGETVKKHITAASERIPVKGRPRYKILVWFFTIREKSE